MLQLLQLFGCWVVYTEVGNYVSHLVVSAVRTVENEEVTLDPTEPVFPSRVKNLLMPKDELAKAAVLGKSGLVSEYMKLKHQPFTSTFMNSK